MLYQLSYLAAANQCTPVIQLGLDRVEEDTGHSGYPLERILTTQSAQQSFVFATSPVRIA